MGSDYFMEASNRHAVEVDRYFGGSSRTPRRRERGIGGSSRTPRPRERDIESAAVRWARTHGWLAIKVGTDGWPDRLFVRDGRHLWVELKRLGGRVTPLQARRHAQLREQGAEVHVCYSTTEVREVLGE